jgi:hypothetical protein
MRTLIVLLALGLTACTQQDTDTAARKAGENARTLSEDLKRDADIAARKGAKAAHELAVESDKAVKKTAHELNEVSSEARKGWKEGGKKSSDQSK